MAIVRAREPFYIERVFPFLDRWTCEFFLNLGSRASDGSMMLVFKGTLGVLAHDFGNLLHINACLPLAQHNFLNRDLASA